MDKRTESRRRRAGEFPPAPEPLAVAVLDSHTHLDITMSEGGGDFFGADPVAGAVAAATAAGVDRLVQVGVDVGSSRWSAELAARTPAVLATVALHPNEAPRLGAGLDEALRDIEALAGEPRVRGIGETGLVKVRTGVVVRAAKDE
jgi:TatD DNase family protein